jgi:hypothetical protein
MTALIIRSKGISILCRTGIAVAVIFSFSAGYLARNTAAVCVRKFRYYPLLAPVFSFACGKQSNRYLTVFRILQEGWRLG